MGGLYGYFNVQIFILALLTTVGFQITSNFANDYGDGIKGTDNAERIGPKRALQSGLLTKQELKRGIGLSVLINIVLVCWLLHTSFGNGHLGYLLLFLGFGAASVWAAIFYTMGSSAYGYRGLGDLFVFIFFGLLGVLGSLFLYTKFITAWAFFPAISIGLLSVGVLNLNNLRDHVSDRKSGKNTLVVKMGYANGRKYHYSLLLMAFLCMAVFSTAFYKGWISFLPLFAFVPIFFHLVKVKRTKDPALLDPELKKLALGTFLLALFFYFTFNIFL
jgi:1,4-dihydroxy-2-naphthoate octaprenyltransferase